MKKQKIETLWRACFTDTDEFIRLFFDEVYREENALIIEKQDRIVAALHLLPYTMLLHGKEFPVSYIYGVGTLPEERGNGLMRKLMYEAEAELKRRNIPLALLIPAEDWLFDIYRKYGYQEGFFHTINTYTPQRPVISDTTRIRIAETTTPELFSYYNQKEREREASVLHTEADFRIIYKDMAISCGKLLVSTNTRNEISGMVFTLPYEENRVFIPEILYDSPEIKEQLLYSTAQLYNATHIDYQVPPEASSASPRGMARIIDETYFRDNDINIASLFSDQQGYITLMLD